MQGDYKPCSGLTEGFEPPSPGYVPILSKKRGGTATGVLPLDDVGHRNSFNKVSHCGVSTFHIFGFPTYFKSFLFYAFFVFEGFAIALSARASVINS